MDHNTKITIEHYGNKWHLDTCEVTTAEVVEKMLDLLVATSHSATIVAEAARSYAFNKIGECCVCRDTSHRADSEVAKNECFDCGYKLKE